MQTQMVKIFKNFFSIILLFLYIQSCQNESIDQNYADNNKTNFDKTKVSDNSQKPSNVLQNNNEVNHNDKAKKQSNQKRKLIIIQLMPNPKLILMKKHFLVPIILLSLNSHQK